MEPLKLCLASPFALAGTHPVAEHVRGVATALAARGHRVTVLAPSPSTRALRTGRRRLRALAGGDDEALIEMHHTFLDAKRAVAESAQGRRQLVEKLGRTTEVLTGKLDPDALGLGLRGGQFAFIDGALEWPSAYFMKSPPFQHHDDECRNEVEAFISKYGQKAAKKGREKAAAKG